VAPLLTNRIIAKNYENRRKSMFAAVFYLFINMQENDFFSYICDTNATRATPMCGTLLKTSYGKCHHSGKKSRNEMISGFF
jgi:hypothetical protein